MGSDSKSGGGSAYKTHDYYGTLAAVVCEGQVDELLAVIADGKEVWPAANPLCDSEVIKLWDIRSWNGMAWISVYDGTFNATADKLPPNSTCWQRYSLARSADYNDVTIDKYGTLRIYWGTQTQAQEPTLLAAGNDKGETHPDYRGICYIVLLDFLFGTEVTSPPNIEVVVRRKPQQTLITGAPAALSDGQANLAATTAEWLLSPNSCGLPASVVDPLSFNASAISLHSKADLAACSPLIDQQATVRSAFEEVAALSDCFLRFNPITGQIEMGVYAHGSPPASYHRITDDDLAERPAFDSDGWSEVKTRAVVEFNDRTRAYKSTSQKVDDPRAFSVLGEHRSETLSRPYIVRSGQALSHAAESLRTLGRPQTTGEISVRREKGRTIRPGDYVLLDIDLEPGGAGLLQYFRVVERTIPYNGPIKLKLNADENFTPIPWTGKSDARIDIPEPVPSITGLRLVEAPPMLSLGNTVVSLVERPSLLVTGYSIWFDTEQNGSYARLGSNTQFAVRATLRTDITAAATTIPINVPAQVDTNLMSRQPGTIQANDDTLLAILIETNGTDIAEDATGFSIVDVASISAQAPASGSGNYDLTVLRGRLGASARSHTAANCEVWIVPRLGLVQVTHKDMDTLQSNAYNGATPDSGYFRLQPFTYVAERGFADCSPVSYRFPHSRQLGPTLAVSSPADGSSVSTYPNWVHVTATASDPNANLTSYKVTFQKGNGPVTTLVDSTFAPCASKAIDCYAQIDDPGTYVITLYAYDTNGNWIRVKRTVTGTGASGACAPPTFWFCGRQLNATGETVVGWVEIRCATPGAIINVSVNGGGYTQTSWIKTWCESQTIVTLYRDFQTGNITNLQSNGTGNRVWQISAYAAKAGMNNSPAATCDIRPSVDFVEFVG